MIEYMLHNREQREKIQSLLYFMGKEEYDGAASLLYKGAPKLPPGRAWVLPGALGMVASIVALPFMGVRAIILLIIFFIMILRLQVNTRFFVVVYNLVSQSDSACYKVLVFDRVKRDVFKL